MRASGRQVVRKGTREGETQLREALSSTRIDAAAARPISLKSILYTSYSLKVSIPDPCVYRVYRSSIGQYTLATTPPPKPPLQTRMVPSGEGWEASIER
jgi:hypothetical protein